MVRTCLGRCCMTGSEHVWLAIVCVFQYLSIGSGYVGKATIGRGGGGLVHIVRIPFVLLLPLTCKLQDTN
ncbi:hypothetical protein BDU57DRAFT_523976 [Ampelomyces quisqualis]|uniref:Uncharacterized protein n=1 Tax=Ampelomyces quisqualis TaxID=50730 RepID=A0A6A5QAP0_AMPQU|nr:hypothetical protein BDU57DRAFT_523976 [Ampelomyces quisqualis]